MADLRARLQAALADRYTTLRELGRGGMAIVFLARDRRHDRDVAVKVLRPELAASLGPERFLLEIKVAAGLTHPHIVPLHDSGEADGLLYYVMPFIQGESLRDRLERESTLPVAEAVQLAREVADALDYAHRQGVVHRDIKPENVLIQDGHAVVADFGIARAISAAGGHRVTATGIAVGTPDYMSPEQAQGDEQVDGRSDIYSLGCVLYEMLTGEAPFVGTTPQEVMRKQLVETPGAGRVARHIPSALNRVVQRAMAKSPANRYQSASELVAALGRPSLPVPRLLGLPRRWWVGLVSAAALGGIAVTVLPRVFLGAKLDRSLYVVVPFGHRAGAAPVLLNGDNCESLLYQALSHWRDIPVVNETRVNDARARRGYPPMSFGDALALARQLGSGWLVWGEVWEFGDSINVQAGLYDVARGKADREYTLRVAKDRSDLDVKFTMLADSLLLGRARTPAAREGAMGTRVLAAWQAYDDGHWARARWDLDSAARAFRHSVELDPGFPHANLWLAQVLEQSGRAASDWRSYAASAAMAAGRLGVREQLMARGLVALADRRFVEACDRYRELVARDSSNFEGWFGLGECHRKDRLVVKDARSRSGWRFRGSYQTALEAYRRALQIVPSVHLAFKGDAFARLPSILFTETNVFREGYASTPDTVLFGAWPALDNDTLAFVPYVLQDLLAGRAGTEPADLVERAVAHNREVLRSITAEWVSAFPNSADALAAHAQTLETLGEIETAGGGGGGGPEERSALATIRRARSHAGDSTQAFRLAVTETRLLLKLAAFDRARALADSLLGAWRTAEPAVAGALARLAVLTGHVHRAAELLPRSEPESVMTSSEGAVIRVQPRITQAALRLLVFSAVGGPLDSVTALERRLERDVRDYVDASRRTVVRQSAMDLPAVQTFPELGLQAVHRARAGGLYLMEWQWALAHGDTAGVRTRLAGKLAERKGRSPGNVPIDFTFQETRLLLQLGDTLTATEYLGRSLDALPTLGTMLLSWVSESAGLVRAMALRAELAARAGDAATAQRWARAVLTLWSDADIELRPTVERMHALARPALRKN